MKLIIHGAAGRMGRALVRALENNGDFQLLYAVDPVLPVRALSQCRQKADCVIDFSHHSATKALLDYCLRTKTPVVVCTLRDTQTVFPNALKLKPSRISVSLLGVIRPEEYEGLTAVELSDRVHKMMADDLGPDLVLSQENT